MTSSNTVAGLCTSKYREHTDDVRVWAKYGDEIRLASARTQPNKYLTHEMHCPDGRRAWWWTTKKKRTRERGETILKFGQLVKEGLFETISVWAVDPPLRRRRALKAPSTFAHGVQDHMCISALVPLSSSGLRFSPATSPQKGRWLISTYVCSSPEG